MLKILRKYTKFIIWIIVAAFGAWGLGSFATSRVQSTSYAGSVFGKKISYRDFEQTYKIVQFVVTPGLRQEDGSLPPLPENYFEQATWEQLAFLHEAKKEKITVSDDELRDTIRNILGIQGPFNDQAYTDWVTRVFHEQPRNFEEGIRNIILTRKLLSAVANEAPITIEDIEEAYFIENRNLHLVSVLFSFEEISKTMPIPELITESKKEEYIARNFQVYTKEKAKGWAENIQRENVSFKDGAKDTDLDLEDHGWMKASSIEELYIMPQDTLVIKELEVEEISSPILSRDGYRVFYLLEIKEAKEKDYEKEKEEFAKNWIIQQRRQALQNYMAQLFKQANIKSYIKKA